MTIQSLLQKGRLDCENIEKIADAILFLPRVLWIGRKVTVLQGKQGGQGYSIKSEHVANLAYKFIIELKNTDNFISAFYFIPKTIAFLGLNLIATPLCGIGLGLKKISLSRDPIAATYSHLVITQLKIDDLKQKKITLEQQLSSVNEDLNTLCKRHSIKLKEMTKNLDSEKSKEFKDTFKGVVKDILAEISDQTTDTNESNNKYTPEAVSYAYTIFGEIIDDVALKTKLEEELKKVVSDQEDMQDKLNESLLNYSLITSRP